jgi:ABC-2 type transport system ATP-binding protein
MISIQNVSKTFGKEIVLDDISIDFYPSTIYGLVGANGCGKTTLMRCICGFSTPTKGKIIIDGLQIGKNVDFAPDTGMILESPGFLPYYSGLKNLVNLAKISGKATPEDAKKAMTMVGLEPESKKLVGKYSLGMNQRLGIAQAIMEQPKNLILDEPFNGLDRRGVAEMHMLLQHLKAEGKTIILACHTPSDIEQACDVVFELVAGKMVFLQQRHLDDEQEET